MQIYELHPNGELRLVSRDQILPELAALLSKEAAPTTTKIEDKDLFPLDERAEIERVPYLNLTNGLEFIDEVDDPRLVRMQSTHLEQKLLWRFIVETDYQFLIDAALRGVNFYDCGSRNGAVSRAQWLGIPWLRYAYARRNNEAVHADSKFKSFFEQVYSSRDAIARQAIQKLDYVSKMTAKDFLDIRNFSKASTLDGQYHELAFALQEKY